MRLVRFLTALLLLAPAFARAQGEPPPITLELNKLEPIPAASGGAAGCRAYLLASNPDGGARIDLLRLDLVLFGTDRAITNRIALDFGPLGPGRTQVRPFELRDQPCDGIGQILINDTMICKAAGADQSDCLDRIRTSSRTSAKLTK